MSPEKFVSEVNKELGVVFDGISVDAWEKAIRVVFERYAVSQEDLLRAARFAMSPGEARDRFDAELAVTP